MPLFISRANEGSDKLQWYPSRLEKKVAKARCNACVLLVFVSLPGQGAGLVPNGPCNVPDTVVSFCRIIFVRFHRRSALCNAALLAAD